MASLETAPLVAIGPSQIDGLADLLPPATARLALRFVEPLSVLSLRHWPGDGSAALTRALVAHGLTDSPRLPQPGRALGSDPWAVWCSPSECRVLTRDAARARALAEALQPGMDPLACAIDISPGCIAIELLGADAGALLSRLVDASALPAAAGQASRLRLAGVAALVLCVRADCRWLIADRAHGHFLVGWLAHAGAALAALSGAAPGAV
jgi:sarcosine oxidase gamma subunit